MHVDLLDVGYITRYGIKERLVMLRPRILQFFSTRNLWHARIWQPVIVHTFYDIPDAFEIIIVYCIVGSKSF